MGRELIAEIISFYLPPTPTMILSNPKRLTKKLLGDTVLEVVCSCDLKTLGHSSNMMGCQAMWNAHNNRKHGDQGAPKENRGEYQTTPR